MCVHAVDVMSVSDHGFLARCQDNDYYSVIFHFSRTCFTPNPELRVGLQLNQIKPARTTLVIVCFDKRQDCPHRFNTSSLAGCLASGWLVAQACSLLSPVPFHFISSRPGFEHIACVCVHM